MNVIDSIVGLTGLFLTVFGMVSKDSVYEQGVINVQMWAGSGDGHGGRLPSVRIMDTRDDLQANHNSKDTLLYYNENKAINIKVSKNSEPKMIGIEALNARSFQDSPCIAMIGWNPSKYLPPINEPIKRRGAIPGDVVWTCGGAWDYSGQERDHKYLRCAWFGTRGHITGMTKILSINTDVISERNFPSNPNWDTYCYWGTAREVAQLTGPPRATVSREKTIEHIKNFANRVPVHMSLSAIKLCNDPQSWGSSFYSIDEGVFCDMSTKTKIPLCTERQDGRDGQCFEYTKPSNLTFRSSGKRRINIKNQKANATVSYSSYVAEYFVISDLNGTITDNGDLY